MRKPKRYFMSNNMSIGNTNGVTGQSSQALNEIWTTNPVAVSITQAQPLNRKGMTQTNQDTINYTEDVKQAQQARAEQANSVSANFEKYKKYGIYAGIGLGGIILWKIIF